MEWRERGENAFSGKMRPRLDNAHNQYAHKMSSKPKFLAGEAATEAPDWLKERMRKLLAMLPPSIEQVKAQWAGSMAQRERMLDEQTYAGKKERELRKRKKSHEAKAVRSDGC
jgi:hypothetical protein